MNEECVYVNQYRPAITSCTLAVWPPTFRYMTRLAYCSPSLKYLSYERLKLPRSVVSYKKQNLTYALLAGVFTPPAISSNTSNAFRIIPSWSTNELKLVEMTLLLEKIEALELSLPGRSRSATFFETVNLCSNSLSELFTVNLD